MPSFCGANNLFFPGPFPATEWTIMVCKPTILVTGGLYGGI
jgi:hypothetical protein